LWLAEAQATSRISAQSTNVGHQGKGEVPKRFQDLNDLVCSAASAWQCLAWVMGQQPVWTVLGVCPEELIARSVRRG